MTEKDHTGWSTESASDTNRALDEARRWIEACTGEQFGSQSFRLSLRDGVVLCKLANCIQPGLVNMKKVHKAHATFVWLENLNYFIRACKELGLRGSQLFDPSDLTVDESLRANVISGRRTEQERQLRNVAITLYWFGRKVNHLDSFSGPKLNLAAFQDIVRVRENHVSRTPTPDDERRPLRRSSSADLKMAFMVRRDSPQDSDQSASRSSRSMSILRSSQPESPASVPSARLDEYESMAIVVDLYSKEEKFGFSIEGNPDGSSQTRVSYVEKGSPAERAGLQVGDRLFWVNGETVAFAPEDTVGDLIESCEKERSVTLGIRRPMQKGHPKIVPEKTESVPAVDEPQVPEVKPASQVMSKPLHVEDEVDPEPDLEDTPQVCPSNLSPETQEPQKIIEEEAIAEVIVQEEAGPENMAEALAKFMAREGQGQGAGSVEAEASAEDGPNKSLDVFDCSPQVLKGFATHLVSVGAVTGAVSTSEEREPVSEVCAMHMMTDEEALGSKDVPQSPHSRTQPTVLIVKPKAMPTKNTELTQSTDDITRLGKEAAAAAVIVDVAAPKAEVKRSRWESGFGTCSASTSTPPASPTESHPDGDTSTLVCALKDLQKDHGKDLGDDDFALLCSMVQSSHFQAAMEAQEHMQTLHHQADEPSVAERGTVSPILDELQQSSLAEEAEDRLQLQQLIASPYLRSLCWAHDQILKMKAREKADAAAVEKGDEKPVPVSEEVATVVVNPVVQSEPVVEAVPARTASPLGRQPTIVEVEKLRGKPLGATIRTDDDGHVFLARLLQGSPVAMSGKLRVGDELLSINGKSTESKTIDEVADMMAAIPPGMLRLEVVPADQMEPTSTEMHVRAHFDYDPLEDELLPCPELGLKFKKGDILHILNQQDSDWWQAVKESDQSEIAGLIPSKYLQERRETFRRVVDDEADKKEKKKKKKRKLHLPKRKKKKKAALYEASQHGPYDLDEVLTYDEVMLVEPHPEKRRPIVIVGPLEGGREALKVCIVDRDSQRFATAVPHTTRPRRVDEDDGVVYHFIEKQGFDALVQQNEFFEHGVHNSNMYGTTMKAVRDVVESGRTCVITIHPDSLRLLKTSNLQPFIIFLKPPRAAANESQGMGSISSEGSEEDESVKAQRIAERMEHLYGHLFEKTIENVSLEESADEFLRIADVLEREPQWVYMTRMN